MRRANFFPAAMVVLVVWGARLLAGTSQALPTNLARLATVTASSSASPEGGKYHTASAVDGSPDTHWASSGPGLPQWLRLQWAQPVELDTIAVSIYTAQSDLYALWSEVEVVLSDGTKITRHLAPGEQGTRVFRLDQAHRASWVQLTITGVHAPKRYLGINEIAVYLDPEKQIVEQKPPLAPLPRTVLKPGAPRPHPTVYVTPAHVARARHNAESTAWGRAAREQILAEAAKWLQRSEEEWLRFLPPPGACYAYGFTGCPICGAGWGQWGSARCSWDQPGKVVCTNGHSLPDADHPDPGWGYQGKDGRIHYFVGSWNAWVTEQWQHGAITHLAHAYALTGDERYAERAAFFLDALASIYAESTSGSWDYPSQPPSGRFARPWYQVARNLVPFVEAYDLIYNSPALEKPSLRPHLERSFPPGPTLQQTHVNTPDAKGVSWEGMTRRDNINRNLMEDGGYYCYQHTFSGALHNGHADYLRGALAVGALLNIPEYVHHAVESPYSIYAMLVNNCDRDGRYYETALGYALHCRDLYLSFTEPLKHWRDERYPDGVDLFADPRFRSFYVLPDLTMDVAGHALNFGDCAPDHRYVRDTSPKFSATDYFFAERLYAGCTGADREQFGRLLRYLTNGDVEKARGAASNKRWLLYNAEPIPAGRRPELPAELHRKVFGSWFLGQKGLAILRNGAGENAQGALLRYGPSLNHGHLDDLNLCYYAKGWQTTYEIGYGLGSTHTQVGWAKQTASHTLVVVNEAPQRGGSGGSLYLFARLPGIQIVEADSPLSYAAQNVSEYRRTVALIGEGKDQYLVDFFRVRGGNQHDYVVGSQGQEFQVEGVTLGPEEKGSLAGPDIAWGLQQGTDGDMVGQPNRPYWNPPPGNGYGFFYGVRRGPVSGSWWVDWTLGGPNEAHFRVHALPEGPAEAIVAKAPGLYPRNRKASYLILRRRGTNLQSGFAAVMEPYAASLPPGALDMEALMKRLGAHRGSVAPLPSYGIVLLRGTAAGDFMSFTLPVAKGGQYELQARFLRSPAYGTVLLRLDGKPVGQPWVATAEEIQGPVTVSFGRHTLAAGKHRVTVEVTDAAPRYTVGLAALALLPVTGSSSPAGPRPILSRVERLSVSGAAQPGQPVPLAVRVRRGERDEIFASGPVPVGNAREHSPQGGLATLNGEVRWAGGAVFAALRGGELVEAALHACAWLETGGRRVEVETPAYSGQITLVNREENWVEVDTPLPNRGLEGEGVYFSHPRYSRNTAYRIQRIVGAKRGSRIYLGTQGVVLGQGRIADRIDAHTLTSEIPHDYARSVVGGNNDRFFDGKRMVAETGAATHLREVLYANPMRLSVDDANPFRSGDVVRYEDVQEGDTFYIPTAAWLARAPGGGWRVVCSTGVRISGGPRVPPTGMEKETRAR
ncbi:MAG: discoidin domain-containing protein [Armatimonadota bacterium]|nr:discoidin domain-containing protein [Armatimonadota bacterium]